MTGCKKIRDEQVKAVVLGHAVGDALGVPVEFCMREELDACPVTDMRGFGTYPVPAGCWSDDTSLSLAALDSLRAGRVDMEDVMLRMAEWYYDFCYTPKGIVFDVGRTCEHAIVRYVTEHREAVACGLTDERSNGNGSLMRIYPFVLFAYLTDAPRPSWERMIDDASSLTHAHERSRLACKIYACVLLSLLRRPEREAVREALTEAAARYGGCAEYPHLSRVLTEDISAFSRDKIQSTGYVVDTLEAAIWCLLTTNSYKACVLSAVNLGDDTDTVAAVAGSLAGALYGLSAIPPPWLATLRRRAYLEELCEALTDAPLCQYQ